MEFIDKIEKIRKGMLFEPTPSIKRSQRAIRLLFKYKDEFRISRGRQEKFGRSLLFAYVRLVRAYFGDDQFQEALKVFFLEYKKDIVDLNTKYYIRVCDYDSESLRMMPKQEVLGNLIREAAFWTEDTKDVPADGDEPLYMERLMEMIEGVSKITFKPVRMVNLSMQVANQDGIEILPMNKDCVAIACSHHSGFNGETHFYEGECFHEAEDESDDRFYYFL